jgi:hypothetical protein
MPPTATLPPLLMAPPTPAMPPTAVTPPLAPVPVAPASPPSTPTALRRDKASDLALGGHCLQLRDHRRQRVSLQAKGLATSEICLPTTLICERSVVPCPSASSLVRWGTFFGSHFMTKASMVSTATAFLPARMSRMFILPEA